MEIQSLGDLLVKYYVRRQQTENIDFRQDFTRQEMMCWNMAILELLDHIASLKPEQQTESITKTASKVEELSEMKILDI